ncbi:MAG TPA: hypothetical protein GX707_00775, partial [Epulopiscium sp.]|nr:hypothetical protein [Candidatus Epulonipiscium sp.]
MRNSKFLLGKCLIVVMLVTGCGMKIEITKDDKNKTEDVVVEKSIKEDAKESAKENIKAVPLEEEKVEEVSILETITKDLENGQLSDEEYRKMNAFFSNFPEAYLTHYDVGDYDLGELISFAYLHHYINNNNFIEIENSRMFIDQSHVEKTIKQFFGIDIAHESAGGFEYKNGKYYTEASDGESYNYYAQLNTLKDNENGTYAVEISIYGAEESDDIFFLPKKNWENTHSYDYIGDALATLKPAIIDGKQGYQLLSYHDVDREISYTEEFYVPALGLSLTEEQLYDYFDQVGIFDYVHPEDGETYMFNPWATK